MSQLSSEPAAAVERPGISREAVVQLSARRGEPAEVARRRLAAWEAYEQIPMPTPRDEEWRRTDIRSLRLESFSPLAPEAAPVGTVEALPTALQRALAETGGRAGLLVQRDGSSVYAELDPALTRQGVVFASLDTVARERPDLFERFFMTEAVRPQDEKFAALHAAFWTGGTFLYVPRGVAVELPFQGAFWSDAAAPVLFPHTLIVAEEGSEVTYVDQYGSADGAPEAQGLVSGVVEIVARPSARVQYVNLQEWGRNVWSFSYQRALIERDATVKGLAVGFGGRFSKARVESVLSGRGSTAKMLGLIFGSDRQHFDHHTLQDHVAPNTTSDLLYKAVLTDHARSVFSGMIKAHKGAQKTDAVQTNRNLLLSSHSRADSIPNLEIEANDLRCTHAAAVAPVDEEQVFYLQSRGLNRQEAVRMIVAGFLEPLLEQIPLASLQARLHDAIERRLAE